MGDNLYDLLKNARETASTADATLFGVEIGIVTNVKDDQKLGRVKVCFPRLPGKPESDWVRVGQPSAGGGRGFYWLPHVHDEVLCGFERGAGNRPYVIGSLWNGKDKPVEGSYTDENTTVMLQTRSGHQVLLSDKDGEEKIVIADKSGKRTLTFDVKAKKLLIEAGEGDVVIKAEKKIVLGCEDLEVKTSKTGKLDIGSTFDLKIAGKGSIKAGPLLTLKGDEVHLNPPSLDPPGLVARAIAVAARQAAAAAGGGDSSESGSGGAGGGGSSGGSAGGSGGAGGAGSSGGAGGGGGGGSQGQGATGTQSGNGNGGGPLSGGSADGSGSGSAARDGRAGGSGGDLSSDVTPAAPAAGGGSAAAPDPDKDRKWLELELKSAAGEPMAGARYEVTTPTGKKLEGKLDDKGRARLEGLDAGDCQVSFPDLDGKEWQPAKG